MHLIGVLAPMPAEIVLFITSFEEDVKNLFCHWYQFQLRIRFHSSANAFFSSNLILCFNFDQFLTKKKCIIIDVKSMSDISGGKMQDSVSRIPAAFPVVPTIQFNDACPPLDTVSTKPKCMKPFSHQHPYLQRGESGTPSAIISSPDPNSAIFSNHCRFYEQSDNHPQIDWSSKNLTAGFNPIKCGSAGDSDDNLSSDSDAESGSNSVELASFHHLHPFQNRNLGKATQFRRHSWIW